MAMCSYPNTLSTSALSLLESVLVVSIEFEKVFVPHLRTEIQRLQKKKIQDKSKKGPAIDMDAKNAKCENQGCQHKFNVILKNVDAYGHCVYCKEFEHHHCAGTSKVMKEEIKGGRANFICTNSTEKSPSLGKKVAVKKTIQSSNPVKPIENIANESLPTIEVTALIHEDPKESIVVNTTSPKEQEVSGVKDTGKQDEGKRFNCTNCQFKCVSETDLTMHISEEHPIEISREYKCDVCNFSFIDEKFLRENEQIMHSVTEYTC